MKKRTVFGKLLRKNGLQTSSHMMTSDKTYDSEAGRLKVTLKSALGNRVPEKEKVTRKSAFIAAYNRISCKLGDEGNLR